MHAQSLRRRFPGHPGRALPLWVLALLVSSAPLVASGGEDDSTSAARVHDQGRVIVGTPHVLEQRDRPAVINWVLEHRLENLLPVLMRESGIDLWIVINREYAEDPVFFSLVPEPVFAARRTTMLLFHDTGEEVEGLPKVRRLSVNTYPFGRLYETAWQGGNLDEQWANLGELIAELDPKRIGVNMSRHWPVADGLTAALRDRLEEVLSEELRQRVVSAEELVVRWIETRAEPELDLFPHIVSVARSVIAEAFSEKVITPGATTAADVEWFIRERFHELQLDPWFQPSVDVQRPDQDCDHDTFCGEEGNIVIERGDVLHTDVGFCYLRLCTDNQEMGYVLRAGEERVPAELVAALSDGNRWQDILTSNFVTGRTGNEIVAATIRDAEAEGLSTMTYTHPLGVFGHSVGPTIGMWDNQGPTPVRGDWPLYPMTSYAIEGNAKVRPESWGGAAVLIKLEQGALFDGETVTYLGGRQTEWHVVH